MIRELPIICGNAVKDMLDEWVLTLCITLSVAAIACPLLILFGLKQGVIQSVRDDFIHDPAYRQITPKETVEYDDAFFKSLESDERVEVVIPSVSSGASVVQLRLDDGTNTRNVDVVPTRVDDPLIIMNDGVVPGEGEVVLTASLSTLHDISVGDEITLVVGRRYNNRKQTALEKSTVVAVVSARANSNDGVYVPVDMTVDIENFRFGRHVDRDGWPPGDVPKTREIYDAMIIGCEAPLDDVTVSKATIRTDFKDFERLVTNGLKSYWPFAHDNKLKWHAFKASGGAVSERAIKLLRSELRGSGCSQYLHWVNPQTVTVDGKKLKLVGLSVAPKSASLFPLSFFKETGKSFSDLARAYVPESYQQTGKDTLSAVFDDGRSRLDLEIQRLGSIKVESDIWVMPVEYLARLRTAEKLEVRLDRGSGEVIVGDLGFSGFRVYANNIDSVPELARDVSRMANVAVHAKTDTIVRVKDMESGLNKIVFIVAFVGLVGGAGALIASLVASVERKKAEMGTYRLIGFNRHSVAFFPVVQGVMISVMAGMVAGLFYYLFSGIVDQVVGSSGAAAEAATGIVKIYLSQFTVFMFGMLVISVICALIAAKRSLRIDPAEALRQE